MDNTLDPKGSITVERMSYQTSIDCDIRSFWNFLAYSGPDTGSWILIGATALLI